MQKSLRCHQLSLQPPGEAGTVLYEAELLHFAEDLKKWKDRYVVIKNDYTVDCFETKEVSAAPVDLLVLAQINQEQVDLLLLPCLQQ